MLRIHKEGNVTIILALVLLFVLIGFGLSFNPLLGRILLVLSIVFFAFLLHFFRNPERKISIADDQIVLAPADGKVVVIEETIEKEFFNEKRIQVSIFMSPLNVHVNRAPFSGEVKYSKYHPGKYLVAWNPKSSELNERTSIVIENKKGNAIMMRQVAGALARRIVNYLKEGQSINQGEDFGFIKFGSRVDLYLPIGSELLINIEESVKGNITPIAKLP